jgi:hypothetical protein
MSKFDNTLNKLITEAEFSALPGDAPQDNTELPPDTREQDDIGEFNVLQLAAKSMLFNPASISDTDKVKFAGFAENGVTAENKDEVLGMLNSYLA